MWIVVLCKHPVLNIYSGRLYQQILYVILIKQKRIYTTHHKPTAVHNTISNSTLAINPPACPVFEWFLPVFCPETQPYSAAMAHCLILQVLRTSAGLYRSSPTFTSRTTTSRIKTKTMIRYRSTYTNHHSIHLNAMHSHIKRGIQVLSPTYFNKAFCLDKSRQPNAWPWRMIAHLHCIQQPFVCVFAAAECSPLSKILPLHDGKFC